MVQVADLGSNLENLVNYSHARFCSLAETAAKGRNFITGNPLSAFTVFYFKGNNFKVVPEVDLRFFKPAQSLIIPAYEDFKIGGMTEFVFVNPVDAKDDRQYAVPVADYDSTRRYTEGDLRYIGSRVRIYLDSRDARRHKVLMAAFNGDMHALAAFLQGLEADAQCPLRVNVNISTLKLKQPSFTTCSLVKYHSDKGYSSMVVKAKDIGKLFLYEP